MASNPAPKPRKVVRFMEDISTVYDDDKDRSQQSELESLSPMPYHHVASYSDFDLLSTDQILRTQQLRVLTTMENLKNSHSSHVSMLHGVFLKLFPENINVEENIRVLEALESLEKPLVNAERASSVGKLLGLFSHIIRGAAFVEPFIFVYDVLKSIISHLTSKNDNNFCLLKCFGDFSIELKLILKHWNILEAVLEDDSESEVERDKLRIILWKCMRCMSRSLENEIRSLPEVSKYDWMEGRSFMTPELAGFNLNDLKDKGVGDLSPGDIHNWAELLFEQIIEFCFRVSALLCLGMDVTNKKYNSSEIFKILSEQYKNLKQDYWQSYDEFNASWLDRCRKKEANISLIREKFSKSRRLAQTSDLIKQQMNCCLDTIKDIKLMAENYHKHNDLISSQFSAEELFNLKEELVKKMDATQNLVLMECRAIDDICNSSNSIHVHVVKEMVSTKSGPDQIDDTNVTSEEVGDTSFENTTAVESEPENNTSLETTVDASFQDEVYQSDPDQTEISSSNTLDEEDIVRSYVTATKKVVLDQLKDRLKLTRANMKLREREAYFRINSKYPDEDEDEDEDEGDDVVVLQADSAVGNHLLVPTKDNDTDETTIKGEDDDVVLLQADSTAGNHLPDPTKDNDTDETTIKGEDYEIEYEETSSIIQQNQDFLSSLEASLSGQGRQRPNGLIPVQKYEDC